MGELMNRERILREVDKVYDEVTALRRHIHMHPELSQHEEHTMQLVSAYLTGLGIPHQTNVGGYGIVAIIGDPNAEYAVALRADMDALPVQEETDLPYASSVPGVMHACGHDIHTATLMGTAKILKGMESELHGAVKLFFQPAEETIGGAKPMMEAGCLENPTVKRLLGFHIDPQKEAGMVTFSPRVRSASSSPVKITVQGESSHGAEPEKGVDAILAASQIVVTLQSIASRSVSPTTPVALTIGTFSGGTKGNIVAGKVEMEGTLRAVDLPSREHVKERIHTIVQSTAAMYGATAEVVIYDKYSPVINDEACTLQMVELARTVLGVENVALTECPTMTAEDVSFFLEKVPGTFFDLGCSPKDCDYPQALHNGRLCPDETCMRTGMLLEVLGALTFLEDFSK